METRNVIIWLIVGLLVLGAGFLGGTIYNSMNAPAVVVSPDSNGNPTTPQVVKDLSSKVIPSIAAYGQVSKIDGKNLTLTYQGDSVVVLVRDDAKIFAFTTVAPATGTNPKTPTPAPTSKPITFQEIKMNDNVTVNFKVTPLGVLEGSSVVVLPPAAAPAK